MKKLKTILFSLGVLFIASSLTGCYNTANNENGGSNYKGELTIKGVGPEISMESTVEEGTLVLRGYFEDHADHVFLKAGKWENFFESENGYLPGNTVNFEGYVSVLDAAAGNHYYDVVNVENIKVISFLDTTGVKEILETYNYCEKDSDCGYFVGECPFGCYIPLNVKYIDVASNIVTNFVNHLGENEYCEYDCLYADKAVCNDYKCEMINAPAEADVHDCGAAYRDPELCDDGGYDLVCGNDGKTYKNDCFACNEPLVETFTFGQCENDSGIKYCTAFQKSADFCTMIYAPVCGNDGKTYGNDCVACQSETVESYTQGECGTQLIDGDKNSLLDRIYKTATFKDIRELGEDYDMKQAISDDSMILSNEKNNLAQFFKTAESMRNDKDERLTLHRWAKNTVEGDLVLYDLYYDKENGLIYVITDYTRDKFSAPEDRVINIRQFENIGTYEHNGIKYGVLYNGEINDEVFQSEDCFVLANLED